MTPEVAFNAFVGLALMLAVAAAYMLLARRFRLLWHPVVIVVAVTVVSVVVSVLGETLFRDDWAGVPAIVRRSAIGGFGWGMVIAIVVWAGRRVFVWRKKRI